MVLFAGLLYVPSMLNAQSRDFHAERLVLDDNGDDGTPNTIRIQAPLPLPQDVILTIPDPGTGTAEFLLAPSGSGGGIWLLGGNANTIPGTHFLGTRDSLALQIQVRGASGTIANSLILNENGSIQRDSGGSARGINTVDMQIARSGPTQVAAGNTSVIGGGVSNSIHPSSFSTTISGGESNAIGFFALYTTIGGGRDNLIGSNALYSTIAGGWDNAIGYALSATIGGGNNNVIDSNALYSTVAGGQGNAIGSTAQFAAIGGGWDNAINSNALHATVAGGHDNTINTNSRAATISGGEDNTVGSFASNATIGGGLRNSIDSNAIYGTIGGGRDNVVDSNAIYGTVAGGRDNTIGSNALYATISGGNSNAVGPFATRATISGGTDNDIYSNSSYSTIGGGSGNVINSGARYSTIGGGASNIIDSTARYSMIGGGRDNVVDSNAWYSTIAGGVGNVIGANAYSSTIPGGRGLRLNEGKSFGFLASGGFNNMAISESNIAVFGNANLWLANNNSTASQLRFYEAESDTGAFPGTLASRAFYTSFEAPALADTIEYILPATKPTATGQVLEVSAISGDQITLTWGTDNTVTSRDGGDVPTAIALPDGDSHLKNRINGLEEQLEAQQMLFQAQEKQMMKLQAELQALKLHLQNDVSSDRIESKGNVGVQSNVNLQNAE